MFKNGGITEIFIIFYGISVAYDSLLIMKGNKKRVKNLDARSLGSSLL